MISSVSQLTFRLFIIAANTCYMFGAQAPASSLPSERLTHRHGEVMSRIYRTPRSLQVDAGVAVGVKEHAAINVDSRVVDSRVVDRRSH